MNTKEAIEHLHLEVAGKPAGWFGLLTCPVCESIVRCGHSSKGQTHGMCKTVGCVEWIRDKAEGVTSTGVVLFDFGGLHVSRDDQNNYRTIGSERQIVRELAERFHEQEDALERIAREFENLGLKCNCEIEAACSICEIRFLLKEYA